VEVSHGGKKQHDIRLVRVPHRMTLDKETTFGGDRNWFEKKKEFMPEKNRNRHHEMD